MAIEPRIIEVTPRPLAVVKGSAPFNAIGTALMAIMDVVWEFAAKEVSAAGHNVAQYDANGLTEAGVEVFQRLPAHEKIVASSTPGGRAATTVYWGSYDGLAAATRELREWCAAEGHRLAGPGWEVYGHWTDDPTKLRTDIFLLLA
jgi:effector-binding domain-containing protein